MSYSIRYGTSKFDKKPKKGNAKLLAALALVVALVAVSFLFPDQVAQARQKIFPFFEPEVQEAFGKMAKQIGEGESFSDAAAAFCEEIIGDEVY